MTRATFFDKSGVPLTDAQIDAPRGWALNDVGRAEFKLSLRSGKCRREILEFGNFVLVEHAKLPPWAGVIDPNRSWGQFGLTCSAYTPEAILRRRRGPAAIRMTGAPGLLFEQMLEIANREGDTLIRPGEIYMGGVERDETLNLSRILDEMQRLAERSGHDFGVEPEVTGEGRLTFRAHWYERRGVERQLELREGHNIEADPNPLVEQGEIINDLLGYGDGATWDSRLTYRAQDAASIDRFGLRQDSKNFSGVKEIATLRASTEAALRQTAWPRRTFNIAALDVGATLDNLRLGDRLPLSLRRAGFQENAVGAETRVRIVALAVDERKGKFPLVVDEVMDG